MRGAALPDAWAGATVACVWLPCLPLRLAVLRQPAWDGRPLVLSSARGPKVVQLCSPEAERAGIRPGLPLREVLALCPEAIIVQPDLVHATVVLEATLAGLMRVSPAVERADEQFFLDLRGLERLYGGDLARFERAIRTAVPPLLQPRIGIGSGKFVAAVAARLARPAGLQLVPANETVAFLAPLSVRYLPLAPESQRWLELLGLWTIGDLAVLPCGAVQAQLGPPGVRAWRLAHGQDDEPVVPERMALTVRLAVRFEDPLASQDALFAALRHLLARAFARPAVVGRAVRQVRLRALLANGTSWERGVTFKEATACADAAYRALAAKLQLAGALPTAAVEELALELLGLDAEAPQQPSLFQAPSRRKAQVAEAARQLRARYGAPSLYNVVEVESWSRIPERRWALAPFDR